MIALYGHGMHDFILRECEVGTRVAMAEDSEWCLGPDCIYQSPRDAEGGMTE